MLKKIQLILILSVLAFSSAFADGAWIAVLETTGDKKIEAASKRHITDKIREEAVKIFKDKPQFKIIDKDSFKSRLPENVSLEDCSQQCAVDIGKKISASYIVQSIVDKPEKDYTLGITVYDVSNGALVGSKTFDDPSIKSFDKMIEKNSMSLFENIIKKPWSGVEYKVDNSGNDFLKQKLVQKRIVSVESSPNGARLSIDGTAASGCPKTPCKLTVEEGTHEFKFSLNRYATQSMTVTSKEKIQVIKATLPPTFGILKIAPKFTEGVGDPEDLIVNLDGERQKKYDSLIVEDMDKHKVMLSHKCYETTEVTIGFDHGGQEHVIDSALTVMQSILDLNVVNEKGEPIERDVYVNGEKKGQSPFRDYVPTCSKITVGPFREKVDVTLKKKMEEQFTHTYNGKGLYTDKRKNNSKTYNLVAIGDDIWFGENLKYKKSSDNCVGSYYEGYRCYYSYSDALEVCPDKYHMATKEDWNALMKTQGGFDSLSLTFDGVSSRNTDDDYYSYSSFSQEGKGIYEKFWLEDAGYIYLTAGEANMDTLSVDDEKNYKFPVRCVMDK